MKILEDRIVLCDAVSIEWSRIVTLKVLNHKLLVELPDALTIEVGGLSPAQIDQIFTAYSHYMMVHGPHKKEHT